MLRCKGFGPQFGWAAGRMPCAPFQERMITSVTTAGAEAGTVEVTPSDTSQNPPQTGPQTGVEFAFSSSPPAPEKAPDAVTFESLGLSPEVLKAVAESGYTIPTPIQAQGIPHVLQRKDIIGIAQTGTGKTASFTLPMIELLARGRAKARMPRSLILEPTRELAAQVAENFAKYGKFNKLSMALLIGGVSFDDQEKKLDRGVDVLIATPGRLLDHFERGKLMLSQVQLLVIDEADRMLDMGFIPDVERICKLVPFTRQTLFYSATMPPEIQRLTEQFLHNPVRVEVSRPATTATNIKQEIIDVPASEWAKREALRRLIKGSEKEITNAIVFCNRKRDVDVVAKSLSKHGFNAAPLHGDLDQSIRTRTLDGFRSGAIALLVASDVAARGLDIPAVSHVFNYDVPFHADDYVHRIGRTGRAGRSGLAYMLATPRDSKYVEGIEKLTGTKLPHSSLEGLAEAVQERPPEDRSRARGGDRKDARGGRNGRDRDKHRDRPRKDHGERASMEPAQANPQAVAQAAPQPVHQPAQQQRTERPREPRPEQHQHRGEQHRAEQPRAHAPKADHRQDHRQPHKQHGQPHKPQQQAHAPKPPGADARELPAFLMRPVKLPAEKPAKKKNESVEA